MRSFDEIVDSLWKPVKTKEDIYDKFTLEIYSDVVNKDKSKWAVAAQNTINRKAYYASELMQPFYGRNVQEPVVKICKRILEKPNRFHLVKESKTSLSNLHRTFSWKVILDKDTNQKVVRDSLHRRLEIPSCLSTNEQELLAVVLDEWYNHQKEILAKKKATREQKRKERFRKELSDLYKEY